MECSWSSRGVLSMFSHFCFFWWSFMSTSTQTSCYVMVILGWAWVGWGGAITFMSTWTHTSCYVMVILGWGWVGWGNNVHVNLHTHVMLRYGDILLHLHTHTRHATLWLSWGGVGLGGVGQWRSCQLAHTRHATLWWSSLARAHTRHATLWLSWGGGTLIYILSQIRSRVGFHCYVIVMLRYGHLGVVS